jgi:hypothetical protein
MATIILLNLPFSYLCAQNQNENTIFSSLLIQFFIPQTKVSVLVLNEEKITAMSVSNI